MSLRTAKRGFLLILCWVGFHGVERFCHLQTDGFFVERILGCSNLPSDPPHPDTVSILSQKFSYLGKGNQCFVFASADGKYVLKFFKYADNSFAVFCSRIPLINRFKPFRPKRVEHQRWKRKRDTRGYHIAFEQWKEETALLAVHLAPTHALPTITITDKLHIEHRIDLNKVDFVLQKRGIPLHQAIEAWMEAGQKEKIEDALAQVLEFCKQKAVRGILDDDGALHNNFGFIEGKLVQLDPGHFSYQFFADPEKEAIRSITPLREWIEIIGEIPTQNRQTNR